jgi:hypothetical protein
MRSDHPAIVGHWVRSTSPERLHSHGLQRKAAVEAVRGSFDSAHTAITQACGNVVGMTR